MDLHFSFKESISHLHIKKIISERGLKINKHFIKWIIFGNQVIQEISSYRYICSILFNRKLLAECIYKDR